MTEEQKVEAALELGRTVNPDFHYELAVRMMKEAKDRLMERLCKESGTGNE